MDLMTAEEYCYILANELSCDVAIQYSGYELGTLEPDLLA